jgi:hypothetical protein
VRRHVRSKRRWHRDYLLAHLVPVVVRLSALVPLLGRQPRVHPVVLAHRQFERAAASSDISAGSRLRRLNGRPALAASHSALKAAIRRSTTGAGSHQGLLVGWRFSSAAILLRRQWTAWIASFQTRFAGQPLALVSVSGQGAGERRAYGRARYGKAAGISD